MPAHPYREAFERRDLDALVAQLADSVVFHSPVIGDQAFEGRAAVTELLRIALDSLTDVKFTHDQATGGAHILVSDARVLGKPVKVTNLLELDADGRIREIWIMARPLTGLAAIAEAIGSGLMARSNPPRVPVIRALSRPLGALAFVTDRIGARMIAQLNRSS